MLTEAIANPGITILEYVRMIVGGACVEGKDGNSKQVGGREHDDSEESNYQKHSFIPNQQLGSVLEDVDEESLTSEPGHQIRIRTLGATISS